MTGSYRNRAGCLVCLLGCFLLSGCAVYRMGAGTQPPVASIYVAPVVNQSSAAQIAAPMTSALKEAFLADGRVVPVQSADLADGTLEVRLTRIERHVAATQPGDTALGESFRLVLYGHATLQKADGTTVFENRGFRVQTYSYVDEDLVQAEYQNVPVLTRDLARKIRDAVLGIW